MDSLEKELFKKIFIDSPIGIELFDSEGKLLDVNKACLDIFDVSDISEVKGFELFKDPNIPEMEMEKLKSGETIRYESVFDFEQVKKFNLYKTSKSGIINLDVLITPLYEDGIKLISNYLVQVQDITERKVVKKNLKKINRALNMISECNKLLLFAKNELNLLQRICKIIVELGGYHLAWVGMADKDEEKTVNPVAQEGFEDGYLETVNITYANTERGRGPTGTAIRTKKPSLAKNILTDPKFEPWREQAIKRGYKSSIALPLIVESEVIGTLNIYSAEPNAFDKEEVDFLMELVNNLAYGIEKLKSDSKRRQAEQELKELNQELEQKIEERTKELKESEEMYRNLIDNIQDEIFVVDLSGTYTYVSPQVFNITGYYPEEVIGSNAFDIVHPDDTTKIKELMQKTLKSNEIMSVEYRRLHKDGHYIYASARGRSIKIDNEIKYIGVIRDITERKKSEEKMRYQAKLVEDVSDAIISTDTKFNIVSWNNAAELIYGWKANEVLGKNVRDTIPVEYLYDEEETVLKEFFDNGFWRGEVIQPKRDGAPINILSSVSLIKDFTGNPIGAVAINRDITERKQAELKIIKEREKAELYLNLVNVIIVALDRNGIITLLNKKGYEILEYEEGELIGKNWFETCLSPHDRDGVYDYFKKLMNGELEVVEFYENQILTKNGSEKVITWSSVVLKDTDGKINGSLSSGEDITERKLAEQNLNESRERFKALFKGIPVPTYTWQKVENSFKLIDYNNAAEEITLGSVKNYIGIKAVEMYRDRPDILKDLNCCMEEKTNIIREMKYYFESLKTEKLLLAKYGFVPPDLVLVHTEDITERKKFEEDLLKEKEFTEMALFAQRDTFFIFDPSTGKAIRWNKAFGDVSGYNDKEISSMKAPDSYYNEEDLKRANKTTEKILKEGEGTIQMDLITKDGRTIPFEYSASIMLDKESNPMYIVSIGRDITERRKAEKDIRDLARFPSENPNPVLRLTKETVIYANDAGQSLFNIQEGSNIPDLLRAHIGDSISNNVRQTVDIEINDRIFSFSITPIKEAGYANLYGRDITEYMHAELKIKESEEKYRSLYEEAPNAYFSISPDKSILGYNKTAEMLLGYTKEEFSKMKVIDLYADTKNGSEKAKNIFQRFLQGEKIQDEELQMKKKSGESFWISLTVKPILDQSGNVIESRSMVIDINKRKEAEEKLKKSEKKFRTIFEANPDLYFLLSVDTTILEYSGPQEDLYLSPEEFLGKKMSEVLPKNVAELFKASMNLTLKTKKPQIVEYVLPIRNEDRFFEARLLYFSENRIAVFIRDITERKQGELNLKESEKNYREAYNKSNFYKDILMHDISNVLQNVQSSVELFPIIQSKPEDVKDVDKLIDIIQKSVDRGTNLISNVRKLSQLEDAEILLQSTELCKILKESIRFMRKSFQEKEIVVHIESPDKQLHVNANELLLDVFENILINAAKYNNNSIVYVLIKIYKERRQNIKYIRIDFIDNGIGIPDANKKAIFQKGFKKDTKIRGMGIGLSLVKKIIESYNGQIWVEDKVKGDYNQGSNFVVLIPEAE